jgi:uncharacterized protein (TIGR03067 family)
MRRAGLLALAALLVLASVPADGGGVRKDRNKLQGDWLSLAILRNGREVTDQGAMGLRIEGNTLVMTWQSRPTKTAWDATFKLHRPSQGPAWIDVTQENAPVVGNVRKGIYAFDGQNLKLCLALPGSDERPAAFGSPFGSNFLYVTLGRLKEE